MVRFKVGQKVYFKPKGREEECEILAVNDNRAFDGSYTYEIIFKSRRIGCLEHDLDEVPEKIVEKKTVEEIVEDNKEEKAKLEKDLAKIKEGKKQIDEGKGIPHKEAKKKLLKKKEEDV